jgi:hypothetical protein
MGVESSMLSGDQNGTETVIVRPGGKKTLGQKWA